MFSSVSLLQGQPKESKRKVFIQSSPLKGMQHHDQQLAKTPKEAKEQGSACGKDMERFRQRTGDPAVRTDGAKPLGVGFMGFLGGPAIHMIWPSFAGAHMLL